MEYIDRHKTCCFSGYRPHKFNFELTRNNDSFIKLENNITNAILNAYQKGYRNFLCGGAMGFDLVCGETVLLLKNKFPDIKLICVLPYKFQSKTFTAQWKERYKSVLELSDRINYLNENYVKGCYNARNREMIKNSSMVITYYSGLEGGTANTVAMANKEKLEIVNVCEERNKQYENLTFYIGD